MLHERTARRRWLSAAGALLAAALPGVLAGVLAKAADESGRSWAADLGSYPAAWVLAVALLAWSAPTWAAAVSRSAVFFAAMTVAYYAWAAEVLDFGRDVRLLVIWLLLSVTAVPATAVAVWWATRRAGVLPGRCSGWPPAPTWWSTRSSRSPPHAGRSASSPPGTASRCTGSG